MTYKTYYRCMLLLPLLILFLVLGPTWAMPLYDYEFGTIVGLPLYLAVLPYCVFAGGFVWATRAQAEKLFMRMAWLSPLMLVPFALASWAILSYDREEALVRNIGLPDVLLVSVGVLVVAYLYVFSTVAIARLLRMTGLIQCEPA